MMEQQIQVQYQNDAEYFNEFLESIKTIRTSEKSSMDEIYQSCLKM